jgi:hypothetical protein
MTPKEEALKLTEKMAIHHWTDVCDYESAKQCALIAVDEILNNFSSTVGDKTHYCNYLTIQYYQEVKQEIEKL